jgi:adenine-specific DNA methylase
MLARYLGNKNSILGPLMTAVESVAAPGAHVVDAFSGSLTVSMALKTNGYRVTANDINLFSSVFSDAYLIPCQPADPDLPSLLPQKKISELRPVAEAAVEALRGRPGFNFLDSGEYARRYTNYLTLLQHLETAASSELPAGHRRTDFFDTYCEDGRNSAFTSSRGSTGRRRFFTAENAARIDVALNQMRAWHQEGSLDAQTFGTLRSGLVRAVECVANTQGTFHDFIRQGWDSRALNPLRFDPPPLDDVVAGVGGHAAGRERDTLDFISEVDDHDVLYLDPPYNFRQYSAYYFMPNVLCRYPEMDDPAEYFDQVKFVRGQNPQDDFTSTFCKASLFIGEMQTLISRAKCKTVVVSYFNGATHWGKFDSEGDDSGRHNLSAMLSGEMFEPGSLRVVEVPRRNYASYGGYTARSVTELLLIADKRQNGLHVAERDSDRGLLSVA